MHYAYNICNNVIIKFFLLQYLINLVRSKFMIKFNKFWLIEDHIKGKKKCMIGCVRLVL